MANTLTDMISPIYAALNKVSREMVGMIPAVLKDSSSERAAVGESIIFPVVAARSAIATAPAAYGPTTVATVAPGTTVTISKSYGIPVTLSGEENRGLNVGGMTNEFKQQAFEQCFRTLVNLIEVDLCLAGAEGASQAYGTAGTAPFGTAADMSDAAGVAKILDDNGCPTGDRQLVLNNAAIQNVRAKQSNLYQGGPGLLERGILAQLEGFNLHQSGGFVAHTKGTGTGYLVNLTAGYVVGSTSIVIDTGANTILKGDILTNTKTGRDTHKYVIPADGTTTLVTVAKPGIRVAWVNNDPVEIALNSSYTPNLAFDRAAIWLVTRPPAVPDGGDVATDAMMVTDPVSGLTFEIREYRQYRQVAWEVAIAWGYSAIKSEHIAILLG